MPQIKDNALRFTNERLEQNYNMSQNQKLGPDLKPLEKEPSKKR